jgi:hypothetical protein
MGIIFAIVSSVATVIAHFPLIVPEGGINERALPGAVGWILCVLTLPAYPGMIVTWMMIWGDNMTGSAREFLTAAAISLAFNGAVAFLLGYVPLAVWQSKNRLQFGMTSMFIAVTFIALAAAAVAFVLR